MSVETDRDGSEVADVLAQIGRRGRFAVRLTIPAESLRVEVAGVGRIELPVSKARAAALCRAARPARHGLKDRTVLDADVRDTWEITRSKIKIDQRSWTRALRAALDTIARDLGLGPGAELRPSLHNMLVYAPGQFFLPHQDSEKSDDMVATLVVTLPSEFSGGEMLVQHHEEKVSFRGSDKELSLIAFYADCHHEVRPVKSGHRIVLTYNLLLAGARDASRAVAPDLVDALERAARDFFVTAPPPSPSPGSAAREPPDRLVYLLDHQYSQRGLGWTRLKGADRARVAALRQVASRLGCEIALALADVHESWQCEEEYDEPYQRYGRRGWYGHDEDEEDDEDEASSTSSTPTLTDLIDSSVELRHFVDDRGKGERVTSHVDADELCFTRPSVDLDPFQSEHEGYMGNWGNTVDRWYHRAAVVLWPRARTFVIRAKASARWAIAQVDEAQRRRQLTEARELAAQLVPFWSRIVRADDAARLVGRTLRVCRALDDRSLAAAMIKPLRVESLTAKSTPALVAVIDHYGLEWFEDACGAFFSSEARPTASYDDERSPLDRRMSWLRELATFVRVICEANSDDARDLACRIIEEQWVWLRAEYSTALRARPSQLLAALARLEVATLAVIESSVRSEAMWLHTEVLVFLASDACPPRALVHLLRTAESSYSASQLAAFGLDLVHDRARRSLDEAVSRPGRASDDWSIALPGGCACALCSELGRFLADRTRTRFEWPLAEEKRAHVHQRISASELPVSHTTRRSGRPYTLALAKTSEIFQREVNERAAWQEGLLWLTRTVDAFRG